MLCLPLLTALAAQRKDGLRRASATILWPARLEHRRGLPEQHRPREPLVNPRTTRLATAVLEAKQEPALPSRRLVSLD